MAGNDVHRLAGRVDTLLAELEESALPAVVDRVDELVRSLVELYGAGLERTVEVMAAGDPTARGDVLQRMAGDDLLAALLVLHDLHPDDIGTRVTRALDQVRPYLGSHAGGVELLGVDEASVVHLRLEGSCDGCASSAETVRNAIEAAILAAAPDVTDIEVDGMVSPPTLLQIQPFRPAGPAEDVQDGWRHVELDVPPGTTVRVELSGEPLAVANLDGSLLAYRDRCPECAGPVSSGVLTGDLLACPGCRRAYDVRRAGRAAEGSTHLEPLPLLPEGAGWKIALPLRVGA